MLRVEDTGVGIPAEAIPHVFERFFRAEPSRSKHVEGVGLGLALAKWIVEQHHGQIEVESWPDRGNLFHRAIAPSDDGCRYRICIILGAEALTSLSSTLSRNKIGFMLASSRACTFVLWSGRHLGMVEMNERRLQGISAKTSFLEIRERVRPKGMEQGCGELD